MRPWRRLFPTAAAAVYMLSAAVVACGDSDDLTSVLTVAPRATNDPPRNEGQFAVCVQAIDVDPAMALAGKAAVEAAFEQIAADDPDWFARAFPERVVDIGCPYPPAATESDLSHPGRLVSAPSYYSTFVFILPDDRIRGYWDVLSGQSTVPVTSEEYTCEGDSCGQETYGLYLSPEDLRSEDKYLCEMYWALYAGYLAMDPCPSGPSPAPVELPPIN